jgi:small GTP-binding protein
MSNISLKQIPSKNKESPDIRGKIVLIGESGVGKSALSIQGESHVYKELDQPTVCFEYFWINYSVNNDQVIRLAIWDTCGQEVYHSIASNFYNNAEIILLVYAINDYTSFEKISNWLHTVKENCREETQFILIGNKSDLELERKVSYSQAQGFQIDNDIMYFIETSAKNGYNVDFLFEFCAKYVYEKNILIQSRRNSRRLELQPSYVNTPGEGEQRNNKC